MEQIVEIVLFEIGFLGGLVVCFLASAMYLSWKWRREMQRTIERGKENARFVENLPRKSAPWSRSEDFIYDGNGELIWDRVRGCVGPSTYIPW